MLPDPLHPAVVHLPIALAVLTPLLALLTLLACRRGVLPARAWAGRLVVSSIVSRMRQIRYATPISSRRGSRSSSIPSAKVRETAGRALRQ